MLMACLISGGYFLDKLGFKQCCTFSVMRFSVMFSAQSDYIIDCVLTVLGECNHMMHFKVVSTVQHFESLLAAVFALSFGMF